MYTLEADKTVVMGIVFVGFMVKAFYLVPFSVGNLRETGIAINRLVNSSQVNRIGLRQHLAIQFRATYHHHLVLLTGSRYRGINGIDDLTACC